jgi:tetratricopeptide (TPR) repeat protein
MSTYKIDKKELKEPDAFLQTGTKVFSWVQSQRKLIFLVLLILFLVIGLSFYYKSYKENLALESSAEVYNLEKNLKQAYAKLADNEKKNEKILEEKLKVELEKIDAISQNIREKSVLVSTYLFLGNIYFDANNFNKALNYFERAYEFSNADYLKYLSQYSIAYTKESLGKKDEALKIYEKLAFDSKYKAYAGDTLLSIARIYEENSNKQKAKEMYEKYKKDYPDSQFLRFVEFKLSTM